MKNIKNKTGFTLIELLIIIFIIALLAAVILVSINQSRVKARINATKTSLRSVLPAIVACRNSGGLVSSPVEKTEVCPSGVGLTGSKWPELKYSYAYAGYNPATCVFEVSISNDGPNLICDCVKQICE